MKALGRQFTPGEVLQYKQEWEGICAGEEEGDCRGAEPGETEYEVTTIDPGTHKTYPYDLEEGDIFTTLEEEKPMSTVIKVTQVIVETMPERYLVRCGTCGGDGRFNGTCHVCDGIGRVFLSIPPNWQETDFGLVRCGTCAGDGRFNGTCHVCNGVGVLVKCFPRLVCGTCRGDGRHNGTCHVCRGVGSVYVGAVRSY